jgi:hypothetical protein
MARCEDFPCCGHEVGCCPDYDESGRQLNMVCTCGARLPINARYSICNACLNMDEDQDDYDDEEYDDYDESMDGDFDSGMSSAGHGMDEDYNGYEYNDDGGW